MDDIVTYLARPTLFSEDTETDNSTAWLGIAGMTVTPEIAEAIHIESDQTGVLIVEVVNDGPADQAGLRGSYKPVTMDGEEILVGGDIIIAFDGEDISNMTELKALIGEKNPNDRVTLSVLRDGDRIDIEVILDEQPDS
jgi:2-alkenal reductase